MHSQPMHVPQGTNINILEGLMPHYLCFKLGISHHLASMSFTESVLGNCGLILLSPVLAT